MRKEIFQKSILAGPKTKNLRDPPPPTLNSEVNIIELFWVTTLTMLCIKDSVNQIVRQSQQNVKTNTKMYKARFIQRKSMFLSVLYNSVHYFLKVILQRIPVFNEI